MDYGLLVLAIALAASAGAGGRALARRRGRAWVAGYAAPLVLALLFAGVRWVPALEFNAVVRLFIAGRTEFLLMAAGAPLLFGCTIPKLRPRLRPAVTAFAVVAATYFVLPFLLPVCLRARHRGLATEIDADGVCRQSTGYTCGPAAAVTALHRLDIDADEGDLAVALHTTPVHGTQAETICRVLRRRYRTHGLTAAYRRFDHVAELPDDTPCIVVVEHSFLVDHFVTLLGREGDEVVLADPLRGLTREFRDGFSRAWRGSAILLQRRGHD